MVRVTETGHPDELLDKTRILLSYQTVVVLVKLRDLLLLELICAELRLRRHSDRWRLEQRCTGRHASFNLDLGLSTTVLVTQADVVFESCRATVGL